MSGDHPAPPPPDSSPPASSPLPPPPPPTMTGPASTEGFVMPTRTPRQGELTPMWRLVTAITWIAVAVAIGSIWSTSDRLGMSTWWLGPRGEPQPRLIQVLPFVPPLLMILATINNARRLPWLGLLAAGLIVAVGIGDLGRVAGLAALEIVIGAAAAAVSLASTTGVYRPVRPGRSEPDTTPDTTPGTTTPR